VGIELGVKIDEKSAYTFTATFRDETGILVVPSSIKWTWADNNGVVINGRQDVVVFPASVINITLNGLDTALIAEDSRRRVLTIKAVYDSSIGSDLNLNREFTDIEIVPIEDVPD
jgi:hypothetical protein